MSGNVANGQLRAFFERIERMHEEKKAISDDIAEIFAEAKATGYDTKVMKIVLQKRRMDHDARQEQEALVDLYMEALGMVGTQNATRAPAQAITQSADTLRRDRESPPALATAEPSSISPDGSASEIMSGEAQQEGVAVGESPMPDPADDSGLNRGGGDEAVTLTFAPTDKPTGKAGAESVAPSNIVPLGAVVAGGPSVKHQGSVA